MQNACMQFKKVIKVTVVQRRNVSEMPEVNDDCSCVRLPNACGKFSKEVYCINLKAHIAKLWKANVHLDKIFGLYSVQLLNGCMDFNGF